MLFDMPRIMRAGIEVLLRVPVDVMTPCALPGKFWDRGGRRLNGMRRRGNWGLAITASI